MSILLHFLYQIMFEFSYVYVYMCCLFQDKTAATVWENLEDEAMYKELDLPEFEQMFSAYQRKDGVKEVVVDNKKKEVKVSICLNRSLI